MTTVIAADFAWAKPSVAQLQSWGVAAVLMYVSHDPSKNANLAVVEAYAVAGIKSALFFEDAATRATGGYSAGQADAAFAYQTVVAYGKPPWAPIVPSMDFDVPDYAPSSTDPMAKLGPVGQYCKAWHDYNAAHGVIADAAYGDYYIIKRLTAAGLCTLGIQTIAWSGSQVDLADIVLLQSGQVLDSGQVDVEVIESAALLTRLAWVPGEASPVTTTPGGTVTTPAATSYPVPTGLSATVHPSVNLGWHGTGSPHYRWQVSEQSPGTWITSGVVYAPHAGPVPLPGPGAYQWRVQSAGNSPFTAWHPFTA